jgi:hypothetical protein
MAYDSNEQFAGNSVINAAIHEILAGFSEPSLSRMLKKIRCDGATASKLRTDDADAGARHTYREFVVARKLNEGGSNLEYSSDFNGQTPDWYDRDEKLLLEVFTCERGGRSDPRQRMSSTIVEKVNKYKQLVNDKSLSFVVAVHGDFETFLDSDDCEQAISDNQLFANHPELSGVIFFDESHVVPFQRADGSIGHKQIYQFTYFANPGATHRIELSTRSK